MQSTPSHNQGWDVAIERNPATRAVSLWLYQDSPKGEFFAKPVELTMEKVEEGVEPPPFLVLPTRIMDRILQALVTHLASNGIRPDHQSVTEGKLMAQSYHLEDLRQMLKLKNLGN